jgi:ABC-type spermidine/putrescine transport system permease subunit II
MTIQTFLAKIAIPTIATKISLEIMTAKSAFLEVLDKAWLAHVLFRMTFAVKTAPIHARWTQKNAHAVTTHNAGRE